MKYEWKKHEKEWYGAKQTPNLLEVPKQKFIVICGKGNPNDTDFSNRVAALYSLAYAVKMSYKSVAAKNGAENGIHDFSVYPLEGLWKKKETNELVKDALEYTIMIRQPDFITKEMVDDALKQTKKKKPTPLLDEIRMETMQDGKCVQILHMGSFDDEPSSFEKMDQFAVQNGLVRNLNFHREIYLNNANRAPICKLKTILRYQVK